MHATALQQQLQNAKRLHIAGKTWTAANHDTWNGCVMDRDQNYDINNTAPDVRQQFVEISGGAVQQLSGRR